MEANQTHYDLRALAARPVEPSAAVIRDIDSDSRAHCHRREDYSIRLRRQRHSANAFCLLCALMVS
jgi:hypothetical protein